MRKWRIQKGDKAVIVYNDDRVAAAKEGERLLGVEPYTAAIYEEFDPVVIPFEGVLAEKDKVVVEPFNYPSFWDKDDML